MLGMTQERLARGGPDSERPKGRKEKCRFRGKSFDVLVKGGVNVPSLNEPNGDKPMRYMMIVRGPEDFSVSGPPPMELMEAIGKLGEEAAKTGKMVSMGGLRPTAKGAQVAIKKGKLVTTDGPFTEAKEVIGGFTIMELGSKEEAVAEAVKFMELHRKLWPKWEGVTEVRPMFDENEMPEF